MTAAPRMHPEPHLIDRLPAVRGRLTADAPLANVTWFRVGGPAEAMFKPADAADLGDFLAGCPTDVPVTVIGVASNLLVRDGGVPGVVIRLGRAFVDVSVNGCEITAGAAALDLNVANAARDAGIAGLEFLSGIPGTIGGALRMNGGAYGRELSDVVVSATALDRSGLSHALSRDDLGLSYRHSNVPEDWIFTSAVLRGHPGDHADIGRRMHEIATSRAESQPVKARTGGSTFANPPGEKAWALIDRAGCRGLTIGGAQVSEKHCNFLLNLGTATADDLESLGEEVRRRVYETSGIELRWEIRRIGVPASSSTLSPLRSQGNRP
ncbi:UDP-N-acetylenolpyruvoylglucosamine reductase [Skermanella aerolata]|uniref:UDP-N-acetylenolpyruvoylglucosamine reductase n=1 Tax=Skermanella aerolata TaxID=393310 RepID=A0A512DUN9_9PROT|nr:UDP-N-acetylmuramate dehydrogenase [Skermanella aerolata]KJB95085.1 UDP-N-acetylenolpyruvoylglucosamine reductase [Skermanella aerolata KACC 11604]GEO40188.1 UDP-N-acetylenolpyruvoylglucosamine reductase [Skermanella aerolata]